jgi:adenine-specific DNA methylase
MPSIERDFPIEFINAIVHKEVQGKKPIYNLHRWWARRIGTTFRMMLLTALRENGDDSRLAFYDSRPLQTSDGRAPMVLDPFMGGGTTIVEALKLGCKVVGVDLNPVAWFVVKKETDAVDLDALKKEFERLDAAVGDRIRGYYKTKCPECRKPADALVVFWVKVAQCGNPACGKDVPLFGDFIIANHKERLRRGTPKGSFTVVCPKCDEVFVTMKVDNVIECPKGHKFTPATGYVERGKYTCPHCHQPDAAASAIRRLETPLPTRMFAMEYYCPHCDERGYKRIDKADRDLFAHVQSELSENWAAWLGRVIPDQEIPLEGRSDPRPVNHNYRHFYQMFNERQLLSLALILEEILRVQDESVRELLLAAFSNAVSTNNMFCIYDSSNKLHLVHMFTRHAFWPPYVPVENNVWGSGRLANGSFRNFFGQVCEAKEYGQKPYENLIESDSIRNRLVEQEKQKLVKKDRVFLSNVTAIGAPAREFADFGDSATALLRCQTSEDLGFIGDEQVDAVISDPPYFSNVMYAELSDFFYVWLRLGLKDRYPETFGAPYTPKSREVVVNVKMKKDEAFFLAGLTRVFRECHRVLKRDGILAFTFHHAAPEAWADVLQALMDARFYVIAVYPVYSEMRTSGHIREKAARTFDTIVVARKRTPEVEQGEITWERLKDRVYQQARGALEQVRKTHPQLVETSLPDVETIVFGHCLEAYSQHASVTLLETRQDQPPLVRPMTAKEATQGIHEIVGALLAGESEVNADAVSAIYATRIAGSASVSFDELSKLLSPRGLDARQFTDADLLKHKKGTYTLTPPDARGKGIAKRKSYEHDVDLVHHLYYLAKSGRVYPAKDLPSLPKGRAWRELIARGKEVAAALFKRTGDETYKRVLREVERLGGTVKEEEFGPRQQNLL